MAALEKAHKEFEDSFIVMTHLESKMSQTLRDQTEYVASHDRQLKDLRERDRLIYARIYQLLSAIGEFIRRLSSDKVQ